jgi:hypothetical protein
VKGFQSMDAHILSLEVCIPVSSSISLSIAVCSVSPALLRFGWLFHFRTRGVVCGVWCVVCGVWCVVCGVWCVVWRGVAWCGVLCPV